MKIFLSALNLGPGKVMLAWVYSPPPEVDVLMDGVVSQKATTVPTIEMLEGLTAGRHVFQINDDGVLSNKKTLTVL